ncbi:hypothetical protein XPA_005776 [Xanthoria parietina]
MTAGRKAIVSKCDARDQVLRHPVAGGCFDVQNMSRIRKSNATRRLQPALHNFPRGGPSRPCQGMGCYSVQPQRTIRPSSQISSICCTDFIPPLRSIAQGSLNGARLVLLSNVE